MAVTLTKEPTSLERYATPGEAQAALRLCHAALKKGYTLSVWDGEEWALKDAWRLKHVLDALCSTDGDTIRLKHPDGTPAGDFWLIWGNAEDGSELIADHTDNDLCGELYRLVYQENDQ